MKKKCPWCCRSIIYKKSAVLQVFCISAPSVTQEWERITMHGLRDFRVIEQQNWDQGSAPGLKGWRQRKTEG
jgi:hypothetical protein